MEKSAGVVALRRQLEKAIATENLDRISDVLRSLDKAVVTLPILRESKVGATVSKLKRHEDDGIASSAKALVKKWKLVAGRASGVQSPSGKVEKVEKFASNEGTAVVASTAAGGSSFEATAKISADGGEKAAAASSSAGSTPLSRQSSLSSDVSMDLGAEDTLSEEGLAPLRFKMRKKLMEALLVGVTEGDRVALAVVARGVEEAMNHNSPHTSKKDDYLGKARQLVFNLKKNDQLRQDVRVGIVLPSQLVVMTSTELMDKAKREAMDKAVSDRTEARMLDWYDKNVDKINKQCGIKETEGMFECGRCKSTKTTYTQKQTRCADEPMTTFVTCSNCKNRWKF